MSDDEIKCNFCREVIKRDAIKCKHCGSVLVPINENFTESISRHSQPIKQSVEYIVKPDNTYVDTKLGHGWCLLILSFMSFAIVASLVDDYGFHSEESLFACLFSIIIMTPWAVWLMNEKESNKYLPAFSLMFLCFSFIVAIVPE